MNSSGKHRDILMMMRSQDGKKKRSEGWSPGLGLDLSYMSQARRSSTENVSNSRYDSLYIPGSVEDIGSGRMNQILVGKRPANVEVALYKCSSIDQIVTEYHPEDINSGDNSREGSQSSTRRKPKHYPYTKPDPPDLSKEEPETPGPNAYDVKNDTIEYNLKKKPGIRIRGRERLNSEEDKEGSLHNSEKSILPKPGPATYHPEKTKTKKGIYSFPKSKRDYLDQMLLKIPGPNHYSPEKYHRICGTAVIKAHTNHKEDKNERDNSPGPGQYYTILKNLGAPRVKFSKAKRFQSFDKGSDSYAAGPLTYNPNVSLVKQSLPRTKIGKADRFQPEIDKQVPGVGAYPVSLDGLNKMTFSFGKQRRFLRKVTNVV